MVGSFAISLSSFPEEAVSLAKNQAIICIIYDAIIWHTHFEDVEPTTAPIGLTLASAATRLARCLPSPTDVSYPCRLQAA
jgi:hypothetical protein